MVALLASLSLLVDLFSIAGGGGSGGGGGGGGGGGSFSGGGSSSGGSGEGSWIEFVITVLIIIAVFVITTHASAKAIAAVQRRRAEMKEKLVRLAAADKVWEPGKLETDARDTFTQYQKDWSSFNLDSMKTYMTPEYYQHNLLMMGALKLAARQNDVQRPVVYTAEIMHFEDNLDTDNDIHTVEMAVGVHDVLKDTNDQSILFEKDLSAREFYKFKRSKSKWLFAGIDQATANPAMRNAELKTFAKDNKYFYSIDWGHLLLPRRGQLFASGSFGVSDINNHVIGLYKDIIIQLYTYLPNPKNAMQNFLIAQTSVPKNYGDIVVQRKKGIFAGRPQGLRKIKMEWSDFNSRYEVFASDSELATSFELLHPKFMEQLQELSFEINIEVVDNMVYLYTPENGTVNSDHYEQMLAILKAAFKEMRL
jgi:hypothetical protein